MNIAILGFAREGRSTLKFILKNRLYQKADIAILDTNKKIRVPRGFKRQVGQGYLKDISNFDIIFRSPGIPYNLPELQKARRAGVKFSSATNLFFEHLQTTNYKLQTRIIGITGTKGKGTTATILYKILKAYFKNARPEQHRRVFLAGNIGAPALDIIPKLKQRSFIILELSSFQLHDLAVSPHIAAVLDVFPDHRDSHTNLEEYYDAKSSIARHQRPNDTIFFFERNAASRRIAAKSKGKKISVDEENFPLFAPEDLKIGGAHNFKNAAMAATIAKFLGAEERVIVQIVKQFRGLPHRLEFVAKKRGITFIDDSAAVNPTSAQAALEAMRDRRPILIAGGKERGLEYRALGAGIRRLAKHAVLYGENKNRLARSIKESRRVTFAKNLHDAFRKALRMAKAGDSILLSPASASYDMFLNFEERGDAFKALVMKLRI